MLIGIDMISPGQSIRPGTGGMEAFVPNLLRGLLEIDTRNEYVLFRERSMKRTSQFTWEGTVQKMAEVHDRIIRK